MVLRRVNLKSYCSLEHYSYICPTSARIHKYEFYFLCLILFSYLQNCTCTVPMHTLQLWLISLYIVHSTQQLPKKLTSYIAKGFRQGNWEPIQWKIAPSPSLDCNTCNTINIPRFCCQSAQLGPKLHCPSKLHPLFWGREC